MANRTIQFCGYAYGNVPVQLNAHINGELVFSGAVDTLNEDMPLVPNMIGAPVLFSVTDSALFPTSFSGSYPMTVSVATGYGVILCQTNSNYMADVSNQVEFSGSISGTTLNVSGVTTGEILSGQGITGTGITAGTKIVSGNGSTWQVNISQITSETTIHGMTVIPGTATVFCNCATGNPMIPPNSDGTGDSRSSVQINGVTVTPTRAPDKEGQWAWEVPTGSTLECNLNVSIGSEPKDPAAAA